MNDTAEVQVWDPLVRLFHWSLVVAFFVAYFITEDELITLHVWAGYVVCALLLFRIFWGFAGPQHARFADFVYPPGVIARYVVGLVRGSTKRYLGHNPAGGAMVLMLLVCLAGISVTGLAVYALEEKAGPLAPLMGGVVPAAFADNDEAGVEAGENGEGDALEDAMEEAHELLANLTVVLVILHIAGVLLSGRIHRENLVKAMFTGRKRPVP